MARVISSSPPLKATIEWRPAYWKTTESGNDETMSTSFEIQPAGSEVDLTDYVAKVAEGVDLPLISDAAKAAQVGALRAAYIMVWLACAESLKRRFREAQVRDNTAAQIAGRVKSMEDKHQSVDKYLLEQARTYGFLDDTGYGHLLQIYENRCLYAHPYEASPLPEKLIDAAATVVDLVLADPVKLRHGFGRRLLDDLLTKSTYLDDQESAVEAFVSDVLPRIDERIHGWLLDQYWVSLEDIALDASTALFFRRGQWFTKCMIAAIGPDVFSADEWHTKVLDFPKLKPRWNLHWWGRKDRVEPGE